MHNPNLMIMVNDTKRDDLMRDAAKHRLIVQGKVSGFQPVQKSKSLPMMSHLRKYLSDVFKRKTISEESIKLKKAWTQ